MSILSTMFLTTALAGSLCTGTLPENCEVLQSNCSYKIGYIIGGNFADCEKIIEGILNNCNKPSTPETDMPDIETPDNSTPEVDAPDTNTPETELPDSSTPETETPETEAPDANIPEIELPDSSTPETDAPSTNLPETEVPDTNTPETEAPDSSTPETDASELSLAEQVVALVNKERAAAGLNPLTINESAMSAALVRAKEIRQSFSHTRPNGSSFSTALKEQGVSYRGSGENIAYGQRSPEEVMKAWMNSSGHRANILNEKYTSIGVGCYEQNGTLYWAQLFIY